MSKMLKVGIADMKLAKSPDMLRTSGLGSCVGVIVYDLTIKIAGMAHVMLPNSTLSKQTNINQFKYADTAIAILVNQLKDNGARAANLKAKLAGGAQMFSIPSDQDIFNIGSKNIDAVHCILEQYNIPVIASDIGGNSGRTIEFSPESGSLKVRTLNMGEKVI